MDAFHHKTLKYIMYAYKIYSDICLHILWFWEEVLNYTTPKKWNLYNK